MFGIIFVLLMAVCAFTFPAFLIDAIRADDEETVKSARGMACLTFGLLVLILGIYILLLAF